jgi:septal ring factor EnvC (AmiA/AmiB activator)
MFAAAALSLSLLLQSADPASVLTPDLEAEIAGFAPEATLTVETLGACSRLFPDWETRLSAVFNAPSPTPEHAAMQEYFRRAYARGKTSPRTTPVTTTSCRTAASNLQGQVAQLQERLAAVDAASPQTDEQTVQVEKALSYVQRMFETLGACERVFPPELGSQLRAAFIDETDPQKREAAAMFQAAYDKGRASPRAASMTSEQCAAEINAINVEIQALKTELEASAD